jgi:trigger factor
LGKHLIGKKAEDVVTISMTGPSAHENEKIKDQDITLVIDTKRVERVEPAPMETLHQQLGVTNDEELDLRVKTYLEDQAERKQQSAMHDQAREQLVEKVELELPEKLSSRQAERTLYRQAMEWSYQGIQGADLEAKVAEARGATEEQSRAQLKQFFVLDKAAKDLDIDVTEQELNGRIAMLAMQQNRRPEKLRQEMQQQGQIEQLYLSIREQKTLEAIIEKAAVTDA